MKITHVKSVAGGCLAIILAVSLGMAASLGTASGGPDPQGPPGHVPAPPHAGVWLSAEEKQALRKAFPPQERKFLVDVGPRLIHPRPDNPVAFRSGFANVYVQFWEPLNAKQRGQLTRMSMRFHGAIGQHTYLAQVRPQMLNGLRNHPMFRGIEMVEPLDKLTPALGTGNIPAHAKKPDGNVMAHVRFFENVRLAEALNLLDQLQVRADDRSRMLFNNRLQVQASLDQISAMTESLLVRSISEVPPPPIDHNLQAAQISNVDQIQAAPFNLDGEGVLIGMWESGNPQDTHPDLAGSIVRVEGNITDHGTHVAGTILSNGVQFPATLGMAPASGQIFSYTSAGNTADEQATAVSNNAIVLSNHSWGFGAGWNFDPDDGWEQTGNNDRFGRYDATAANYDSMIRDTGLIVQKSSGNDGNDCNPDPPFDCDGEQGNDTWYRNITLHGNAKNLLSVGAVQDDAINIANFSSKGPTNDWRVKPDIVANGTSLTSTCVQFDGDDNIIGSTQCSKQGTSMSSPTVTGTIALLVQRYRDNFEGLTPSPDIIKAILVNTAEDLGRPGPDYIFGHGLLDGLAAVETIDIGAVRILTSAVDAGDLDEFLIEVPGSLDELRVTLAWVDPEGPADAGAVLINDLDVTLRAPDNTVHFPFTGPTTNFDDPATATGPNSVDNVEHARVDNPAQGIWRVRVNGTEVPDGPQNYALVSNASFLLDDQPNIKVNAPLDYDELCADEFQDKTVSIFNTGGADLWVHEVSVVEGMDDFLVLGHPIQPFIVQPGAHVDLTVRFAPSEAGLRTGVLQILSNDADEGTLEIEMTGSGGEPVIATTFIPNFGDVCLEDSKIHELRITNPGSCPLSISGISSSNSEWSIAQVLSYPLLVSSGGEITVPIEFDPVGNFGGRAGSVSISHDGANAASPRNLNVSGNSPPGSLNTALANEGFFGNVCKGDHADLSLTLFNQGQCNLTIDSIGIDPANSSFELPADTTFPLVLSPDADFNVPVRYAPEECNDDVEEADIVIVTDDPDKTEWRIDISGTSACPNLVIDPVGLEGLFAFPATVVDTEGTLGCYSDRSVVLRNNGGCPLTIDGISATGDDFAVTAPTQFPVLLPPGEETLSVDVRFTPTGDADPLTPSEVTGELTIVSDDPDAAGTAALCGESAAQSGVRILVTDITSGDPIAIDPVERIDLSSKGKNRPGPIKLTWTNAPVHSASVCGNTIAYHVNQESLPATDTTGGGGNQSSYEAKAKEGNLQTSDTFALGQCELRDFQLQLQSSNSDPDDPPNCPLGQKGDFCETDGECCSGRCRGPAGAMSCR